MPKHRTKKSNGVVNEPYPPKKQGNTSEPHQERVPDDNDADEPYYCDVCTTQVDRLIQCEYCSINYCCPCGEISEKLFAALVEFKQLHWFCPRCDQVAIKAIQQFGSTVGPSGDILSAVTSTISAAIQSLQDTLKTTIKDLVSVVTSQGVPQNTESVPAPPPGNNELSPRNVSEARPEEFAFKMVDEYRDRERRKLNLIFHNVPESHAEESSSRVADDIKLITDITKAIGVDNVEVVNTDRLGQRKNSSSGGRLLRVQVSNLNTKKHILSNAKKLRNVKHEPIKGVYITPDLSIKERNAQKALRDELKRRKDAGEANLKISRGKIIKTVPETAMAVEHTPEQTMSEQ